MSKLQERLERYLNEEECSCTSVSKHKKKLMGLVNDFPETIDRTISILKAIAEENRLKIIHCLAKSPLCACELEFILDVSQPTVTYHLQILRKARLIRMIREGKWTTIKLKNPDILSYIDSIRDMTDKDIPSY